jgi:hypothetical protein
VSGAYWNVDRDEIDVTIRATSVIRMRGGWVIEHRDYVDYRSAVESIDAMRRAYGSAPADRDAESGAAPDMRLSER